MTWKIYYTLSESIFRQALNKIQEIFGINVEEDEETLVAMGDNPYGLVKLRGSRGIDATGKVMYKIIGIIEDFKVLSMLEPHLGAPQKIQVPKPSFLDFAHLVVACRQLSKDQRLTFLRQNLNLSPVGLEHYIRELKASAARSPTNPILQEAANLV